MTLSNRIVFSTCLMAAVLAAGFLFSGLHVLSRVESALLSLSGNNVSAASKALLNGSEKILSGHGRTIARDRNAMAALADGDIASLVDSLTSTFNRISASGEMSDLLIYDKDGTLVSAFSSNEDAVTASETPEIVETVKASGRRNFAINRIGGERYGAAYAFPLLKGREIVGYAVLALDVEAVLPDIAAITGATAILTVVSPGGDVRIDGFAAMPEKAVDNSTTENAAEQNNDQPKSPESIADAVQTTLSDDVSAVGVVKLNDKRYVATRLTFGSVSNEGSLELLIASDFTQEHFAKTNAIRHSLSILSGVLLTILVAMLFWLKTQMRPLKEITAALLSVASGKTPVGRVRKRQAQEIAELTSALDVFIAQAEKLAEESRRADVQAKEIVEQSEKLEAKSREEAKKQAAEAERLTKENRHAELRQEKDRTAVAQISEVVNACARGDFTRRLEIEDKEGVFKVLCEHVNQIGEAANAGLDAVKEAIKHLAEKDLSHRMPEDFEGVFAEISSSMNATASSLNGTLGDINTSSSTVGQSTKVLASTVDSLAKSTEVSAFKLENTASALEQMTATIQSMAESAKNAETTVRDISIKATEGHDLVVKTQGAMDKIQESSNSIGKIINVIEEISFQTNLLALNAGVEAARAGEQGRGFSVVASEVRELALRSAASANEISALIEASQSNVESGVVLVQDSGQALAEIVTGVVDTQARINEIADATTSAATTISEISEATNELDRRTQKNAGAFEETNGEVQSLNEEARTLTASIAEFTLIEHEFDETTGVTQSVA